VVSIYCTKIIVSFGQNLTLVDTATDNKELQIFFKNLAQGLKKYSLQELNENLSLMVTNKADRERQKAYYIDCVLTEICQEFSLTKPELVRGRGKGVVQVARKYAYCILHDDFEIPIRHIAKNVFNLNWHTSVSVVIQYKKTLNMDVKPDREFSEKLEQLKERILKKIHSTI
jgi:hypothetical protein